MSKFEFVITKFKNTIKSNHVVLKNMTWLTVLQFANYLIPLLIIPYIVRVLGADTFGKVSYAQNIISYLTIIINFGFDYSATREIAINKYNREIRDTIFWTVIRQKLLLMFVSFSILMVLYFSFDKVANNFTLYLFVFLLNFGVVIFPVWFFQGMEDMKAMSVFNMLVRSSGLFFTFIFVKNQQHYLLYPLLISIGYFVSGFFSFLYVIKHYQIGRFQWKNKSNVNILRISTPIFLNTLFATMYTTANLTIIGLYYDDFTIGLFGGVQKIIVAIMMITNTPLNLAIFPQISRKFNESKIVGKIFLNKILKRIAIYGLTVSIITFIFADPLVKIILGAEFISVVPLMKLLSALPFLVIIASLFTIQGLYAAGLQKYAPYIGATLGIVSITFNLIIIPQYGIIGAGWAWIISECLEIILAGGLFYWKIRKK